MRVIKVDKPQWHDFFKEIFTASFPIRLWMEADDYDFALLAFGERNHFLSYATIKETGKRTAFFCFFAVNPAYLRQGFGFVSGDHMIDRLRGYYTDLKCFVDETNVRSEQMIKKLGFERQRPYDFGSRKGFEYIKKLEG